MPIDGSIKTYRALSCTQRNWPFTPIHVSLLVCTRRKASPAATRRQYSAPGEAWRRKAEACSGANDTWCYFSDLENVPLKLRNWARPSLNALANNAVGVAILTILLFFCAMTGRNCNIRLHTRRLYTAQTCKRLAWFKYHDVKDCLYEWNCIEIAFGLWKLIFLEVWNYNWSSPMRCS